MAAELQDNKHGSTVFTAPHLNVVSTSCKTLSGMEIIHLKLSNSSDVGLQATQYSFLTDFSSIANENMQITIGDFNCHHTSWGHIGEYMGRSGESLKRFQPRSQLH